MTKRMEDMTREEILKEFEGGEVIYRAPRRIRKLVPMTLRVHPDLVRKLSEAAKKAGIAGHTTMARVLLEQAVAQPDRNIIANEIAEAVAKKLRKIA